VSPKLLGQRPLDAWGGPPNFRDVRAGCSTGYMSNIRGDWPRLLEVAAATSAEAVELSALSPDELPGLIAFLNSSGRLPFEYVSVHAPTKGLRKDAAFYVRMLLELPAFVESIVFHPDIIASPESLAPLGTRVVLENMDSRKELGQTASSLAPYFEALPEAGFCLDIAHASVVDPSQQVADSLLLAFGHRLREVHLSSLDPEGRHVAPTRADFERFAPILNRCRGVTWILEAPPIPGVRRQRAA
jgi:xylose isomerase-like TIM barrel protein